MHRCLNHRLSEILSFGFNLPESLLLFLHATYLVESEVKTRGTQVILTGLILGDGMEVFRHRYRLDRLQLLLRMELSL